MKLISTVKNYRFWIALSLVLGLILAFIFRRDIIDPLRHQYRIFSADIEILSISIPKKDVLLIDSLRKDVLKYKTVKSSHKQYISGTITNKDKTVNVKIRLKGDQLDHYQSDPPSFRVKTKKDETILGTNKFSIQSFGSRNFFHEWVYHRMLKDQNVLSLYTDVIEIEINGKDTVYTFEEHFTHHLTDRFGRPRGPILCISEDLFWDTSGLKNGLNEEEIYRKSPIKTFNYYAPLDSNMVIYAENLLDDFRNNRKSASEVFDLDKLAIHFAICDLCNTHHALRWHNNRFYYNPKSERLEPIGFDGSSWGPITKFALDEPTLKSTKWSNLILDPIFISAYLSQLNKIVQEDYLSEFLEKYQGDIYRLENKIFCQNSYYPNYDNLRLNSIWIKEHLAAYEKRLLEIHQLKKVSDPLN